MHLRKNLRKRTHGTDRPNLPKATTERVVLSTNRVETRRSVHRSWTRGPGSLDCLTWVCVCPNSSKSYARNELIRILKQIHHGCVYLRKRIRRAEHRNHPTTVPICRWGAVAIGVSLCWRVDIRMRCRYKCDYLSYPLTPTLIAIPDITCCTSNPESLVVSLTLISFTSLCDGT